MNYKNEAFLDLGDGLIPSLESIAVQLASNLITPGQFLEINTFEYLGAAQFKEFWKGIPINNPSGNKHSTKEHKGIYAFGQMEKGQLNVLYIGISQTIRRRFFKHTRTKEKNGASWAYTIAKHQNPLLTKNEREALIPEIQRSFIKNCRFTFVPVDCNMMLHLSEVYCANKLRSYWNSFETH